MQQEVNASVVQVVLVSLQIGSHFTIVTAPQQGYTPRRVLQSAKRQALPELCEAWDHYGFEFSGIVEVFLNAHSRKETQALGTEGMSVDDKKRNYEIPEDQ